MKPIIVISHVACEHPGHLFEHQDKRNIPYEEIRHEQGGNIPGDIHDLSRLALLGAPVSVNDSLTWIKNEIALIKSALEMNIPMLGICFGAQHDCQGIGCQGYPDLQHADRLASGNIDSTRQIHSR